MCCEYGARQGKKALELDPVAKKSGRISLAGKSASWKRHQPGHILADGDRSRWPTCRRISPGRAHPEKCGVDIAFDGGLREQMRRVEADIITRALRDAGGDRRLAAQKLDIGLSSLYRKLEEIEALSAGRIDG